MALSIKTKNYIRAEKLNRSEENRFQERLNFLDWQYLMRSKHHEERMEKIRLTMQLLNNSTGVSDVGDSIEFKSNKKMNEAYHPSELYIGSRRFWLTGPTARGQTKLSRLRTPMIHSSRTNSEVTCHLGWKTRLNDIAADSLDHPLQSSEEPYDELPLNKSSNTDIEQAHRPADRLGRTINKVGLSLKDHKYLTNSFRSDLKILRCTEKINHIQSKIQLLQQRKLERDALLQDLERAKNDPFYGLE